VNHHDHNRVRVGSTKMEIKRTGRRKSSFEGFQGKKGKKAG